MIEDITAYAAVIGINSQAALDFDDAEDAKIVLSSLQGVPSVVYASLMDEYGEFFASYQRDEGDFSAQLPPVNNQALYSDNWLLISQDIFLADDQLIGRVFIQSDTSELNSLIVQSTVAVVAIGIFALLISYFLASKLQAVISTPILELTLNCWKLWAIE